MRSSKSRKHAKAKADKYFSLYIRERDKGKKCCTCKQLKSDLDCGHFISRGYEATRYDEKNSHGQCPGCNRFRDGRQYEHSLHVDKLYGEGTAKRLLLKSKMFCKRDKFDYESIAEKYKQKYENLKNDKNRI